jgi:MFS family permease
LSTIRLGLRANARQFGLLVALNALVGAMVGLERSIFPLIGKDDFGLRSSSAILAFVVAFGAAKAVTNLAAGELAERVGRKRLLVLGWLIALPVPILIGLAPSWWLIVAANVLLGANQGFAWSMTVVMKIDLAGPKRRGGGGGGADTSRSASTNQRAISASRCPPLRPACSPPATRRAPSSGSQAR